MSEGGRVGIGFRERSIVKNVESIGSSGSLFATVDVERVRLDQKQSQVTERTRNSSTSS
jgi:hypothetical protein